MTPQGLGYPPIGKWKPDTPRVRIETASCGSRSATRSSSNDFPRPRTPCRTEKDLLPAAVGNERAECRGDDADRLNRAFYFHAAEQRRYSLPKVARAALRSIKENTNKSDA